jgi:hypothetical protein
MMQKNEMGNDALNAHVSYLEDQVKKITERADRLEATIPALATAKQKHAMQELVHRLRDEVTEHRKYLALIKPSASAFAKF